MFNTSITAILGILFLVLGFTSVFLMFHLWGYPFDKATRTSAAPKWAMYLHRAIGFMYAIVYVVMMWQMVPRMFSYQVEFPARTVAHIILALTIGFILIIKISIVRFFRHLEEWMPYLGTSLLLCTILLLGLSLPFTYKEKQLAKNVYSAQNIERLKMVLPGAEFPKNAPVAEFASVDVLRKGRKVLLQQCVECHDLKTILTKPRSPQDWVHTVERMAEKPAFTVPLDERAQWAVSTYLIAITPEIQESASKKRKQELEKKKQVAEAKQVTKGIDDEALPDVKESEVKPLLEKKCTQCHELDELDKTPTTMKGVDELLSRMVDNGAEVEPAELKMISAYLKKKYAQPGSDTPKPTGTGEEKPKKKPGNELD